MSLAWGCSQLPPAQAPAAGGVGPTAGFSRQDLYRCDYSGPDGGGRWRMVVRSGTPGEFQLAASDPLGRAVWSLYGVAGEIWLVDHRARALCRSRQRLLLPDLGLEALPIDLLPRVLDGRLPIEPPRASGRPQASGDEIDFVDSEGRRWTARRGEGRLTAWTLWADDRPLLWWSSSRAGEGILSHRRGSQLRWRRTLSEAVAGGRFSVEIPEGYDLRRCGDWNLSQLRQDQPASAGDRPPS